MLGGNPTNALAIRICKHKRKTAFVLCFRVQSFYFMSACIRHAKANLVIDMIQNLASCIFRAVCCYWINAKLSIRPIVGIMLLLSLIVPMHAEVERLDEAPVISFNSLVWFVPNGPGTGQWVDGDLNADYRSAMGHIERKPLTGPQKIKWKNRFYDLNFIGKRDDGAIIIQFAGGLLVLTPWGEDRGIAMWEGAYTVEGAISSPMRFRTSTKGMRPDQFIVPPK